jgi:hypothetical protein
MRAIPIVSPVIIHSGSSGPATKQEQRLAGFLCLALAIGMLAGAFYKFFRPSEFADSTAVEVLYGTIMGLVGALLAVGLFGILAGAICFVGSL